MNISATQFRSRPQHKLLNGFGCWHQWAHLTKAGNRSIGQVLKHLVERAVGPFFLRKQAFTTSPVVLDGCLKVPEHAIATIVPARLYRRIIGLLRDWCSSIIRQNYFQGPYMLRSEVQYTTNAGQRFQCGCRNVFYLYIIPPTQVAWLHSPCTQHIDESSM